MTKKIDISIEHKNANLSFLASAIRSVFGMIIGFLIVKITITFYGESINGVIRFITQIFTYVLLFINSINLAFSLQVIKLYKKQQWEKIYYLINYIKVVWRYFAIIYLVILSAAGFGVAAILSNSSIGISFWFVFSIFIALSFNELFAILGYQKYDMYYSSINKGYVVIFFRLISQIILFSYFILSAILFPPKLHTITDPQTHVKILTIMLNDKRVFNLSIALLIYSLFPLLSTWLVKFKFKNDVKNMKLSSKPMDKKEWAIIKKDVWNSLKYIVILSISGIIIGNTDEFIMLFLRTPTNENYILKMIGIYGIYSSILMSIAAILINYINSKKVLISMYINEEKTSNSYIDKIKYEAYILALIFFISTIVATPIIITTFFNPGLAGNSYFNFGFSIPMSLLCALNIIFLPEYLLFQLKGKFILLIIVFLTEAIINIVLSISFARSLGITWILWSSVIACFLKILFFRFILLFKYKSKLFKSSFKQKLLLYSLIIFAAIEITALYLINISDILYIFNRFYFTILLIVELCIFSLIIFKDHYFNLKKMRINNK